MTKTNKIPISTPETSSRPPSTVSIFSISNFISSSILWLLILAYVLFFSAYSLQRHATFNTFAADLSYIDQPMWNTLHGRFLERTLDDRQVPRVAEHFEPIIIPIALVFYLWDDVRAILIIQTVALALGALPVYWIAREQISNTPGLPPRAGKYQISNTKYQIVKEWLPLAFVIVYLMFPALQAANVADFHADPFVVTPFLLAFWYATQRRYRAMWAWAVVAMLVKENLPTLTFMLGLYLLFSSGNKESGTRKSGIGESGIRKSGDSASRFPASLIPSFPHSLIPSFPHSLLTRRRLHGLALMAVSLAWFYAATFLIVAPLARQVYGTDGPIYLTSRYAEFGGGLTGLLRGLLTQPSDVLALLRETDRLHYLVGLFVSVGWLALLAPEYLLLGLPVLIANTLSNFPGQYSGEQHYSAPLAPIFIIAAIYGARRLVNRLRWVTSNELRVTESLNSLLSTLYSLLITHHPLLILVWLLAWSLGYHYLRGWTPLARDFDWPQRTAHYQLLARFADQIPPDVPLSTTPPLHPHLAHREKIYVFPTVADADFVLLDVSSPTDAHPNDVRATYEALIESGEFGVVDAADGYVLLGKRLGAGGWGLEVRESGLGLPDAFYDFARVEEAQPQYPVMVEFDGRLHFLGYDVVDDPKWRQTYLRLYWQALAPLSDDLRLWPFFFSEDGFLVEDTSQRPMVTPIWYPLSQWRPGEIIVTETLPWDLGPRFNVGLATLSPKADPVIAFTDPEQRLPITTAGSDATLFHEGTWAQVGTFARDGRYLVPAPGDPDLSPLDVTFAEGIRLAKYQISKSANQQISKSANLKSPISVVLQWQATAPISRDYTVFVHLVAPDGTLVAQSDAWPTWVVPWPTDRWSPDQPVLDGHRIPLPSDLPRGRYEVRVGLYYWETLEQLPVLDESGQPVGNYAVLDEVQIRP